LPNGCGIDVLARETTSPEDAPSEAADWQPYVLTDGLLITGQNPASSGPGAKALLEVMSKKVR
jgi:hypothetical protein